jgi:hypothetical protein
MCFDFEDMTSVPALHKKKSLVSGISSPFANKSLEIWRIDKENMVILEYIRYCDVQINQSADFSPR